MLAKAPADAAVRECAEELGCEVRLDRLVGVYYVRRPARRHRIGFLFEGILDGATPALADDELDDLGWFPCDGLPRRSSPGLDIVIADARSGATGVSKVIDDAT